MRKLFYGLMAMGLLSVAKAQNPATTFQIANRLIQLPCGTSCTTISAVVPHLKQTTDYVITNPAYVPFAYTSTTGTEVTAVYTDDYWSGIISLPFSMCFYGNSFPSLLMGSNSAITFDLTRAGLGSGYSISASGQIPNTTYAPNMIFGPYHDIDPSLSTSPLKKIEWRVEGVAPKRRFIASYNAVPYFGSSCTAERATHQMVLYESTGIIEIYIHDKPACTGWNGGRAILGVQDGTRTQAVAAAGKNATVWGSAGMDSCFRFTPSGAASRLKSAKLKVNGTQVATADTSTLSAGLLNLNFPNVCPTADSTAYVIEVTYGDCNTPTNDVIFTDTVVVKKLGPAMTVAKTDPNCSPNGTITLSATGGITPYQYSINGGTTWQASNSFTGLAGGTYQAKVKDAANCSSSTQAVTLATSYNLSQTITKTDANCTTTGTITVTAAGGTPPYEYSINGTTWQSSNTFTGLAGGNYTVTTRQPNTLCTVSTAVTIAFTNNLTLSTIAGGSVCFGASFTPTVTSNATGYSWSPSTGVSNTAIATPTFSPASTTTYTLTGTLGTCTTQGSFTLTIFPGATANAGPDAIIIAGDTYSMQGSGSVGTYSWTPTTALSSASALNPNANPTATTTYTLRVTTTQGCVATDNMTLTVVPYCIKPMNAFSPNGDGINDLWLITNGNCLLKAKAQVFNRYGAKVFEEENYRNTWNGTYNGKPLPDGTYYYVITFQLINNKVEQKTGNVTILR